MAEKCVKNENVIVSANVYAFDDDKILEYSLVSGNDYLVYISPLGPQKCIPKSDRL